MIRFRFSTKKSFEKSPDVLQRANRELVDAHATIEAFFSWDFVEIRLNF